MYIMERNSDIYILKKTIKLQLLDTKAIITTCNMHLMLKQLNNLIAEFIYMCQLYAM